MVNSGRNSPPLNKVVAHRGSDLLIIQKTAEWQFLICGRLGIRTLDLLGVNETL